MNKSTLAFAIFILVAAIGASVVAMADPPAVGSHSRLQAH